MALPVQPNKIRPPIERTEPQEASVGGPPVVEEENGVRALAFVGDELWAQRDNVVHRLFGTQGPLVVPESVRMIRAVGRWIEFRHGSGLGGWRNDRTGSLGGIWLYDADTERWHAGPWPEQLQCFVPWENREPEDCILENPRLGLRFDLSGWEDRHSVNACAPDGRFIAVDGRLLDLATGDAFRISKAFADLKPEHLPIVGSSESRHKTAVAEAVVRHLDGEFSWILSGIDGDEFYIAGIAGVLGRGEEALAWVGRSCLAAAFTADASRIAFMSEERVWVVDAANPTGPPLLEHTFERASHDEEAVDDDLIPF